MKRLETVSIRTMTFADLDAVLAIEADSFTSPWTREQAAQELDSPSALCLVACTPDGVVAGYLFLMFVLDECTVMDIAVQREMRGQGIARRLMEEMLAVCRERGCRTLHLEVRLSAAPAIALYRSFGFIDTGSRRRYYRDGEDAITMSLALHSSDSGSSHAV
jgi:ribosomal-protein-alanine N-acetyltransferase